MAGQDILLYENPMDYMGAPAPNPGSGKRKRRRNPSAKTIAKRAVSFQGVNVQDVAGAILGFAASAMTPGYVIQTADTELKKAGKVGLSLLISVLMKGVGDAISPGMGKAAMYGGFAGTGAQAMKIYAPASWPEVINKPAAPARTSVKGPAPSPAGLGRSTYEEFVPVNAL